MYWNIFIEMVEWGGYILIMMLVNPAMSALSDIYFVKEYGKRYWLPVISQTYWNVKHNKH